MHSLFIALYHRHKTFCNSEFIFLESFKLKAMQWYLFLKVLLHWKKKMVTRKLYVSPFNILQTTRYVVLNWRQRLSFKTIMKKNVGRPIKYVKSTSQKNGYWVLFNVFWRDLRKIDPWKEELVLVYRFL